jgi:sec-independent protein translocase protein TatB
MFPLEQGAFEMLLIGAIALIVVGPKDLPMLMRKVGQFTAKMRGLAAEFRASFDEMARQSELDELRKEVDALRTGQYTAPISAEIDKHMYGYDQAPTTYPSLPEPSSETTVADTLLSSRETGGGDHAQHGEGGEQQPPPPPSAVPLPPDAGEEIAAKPKKPRAPRKPKSAETPDVGQGTPE